MFRKPVYSVPKEAGVDGRYIHDEWRQTNITFKARSESEAMKKADKFWQEGGFGMGSICVQEEREA